MTHELYLLLNKVPNARSITIYSKIVLMSLWVKKWYSNLFVFILNVMCDHAWYFICFYDSLIYMMLKF